ncbi:MAG: DUF192 domain-containing protein [Vulcanimicrobiaceae bacterium]
MPNSVLKNATSGAVVAERVARGDNFVSRGLGLLPRATVAPDEGIWLRGCSSVHTIGMRAVIDLIFLDRADRVVRIVRGARPNRPVFSCRGAHSVIELGAVDHPDRGVAIGDRLTLE